MNLSLFVRSSRLLGVLVLFLQAVSGPLFSAAPESGDLAKHLIDAELAAATTGPGRSIPPVERDREISTFIGQLGPDAGSATPVLRPKSGDDLSAICRDAHNGQIIELAAGTYPGMVAAANKRLVLRGVSPEATVLTGGQVGALVGEGGTLVLENLAMHPATPTPAGIYVQKGNVIARHCTITGVAEQGCVVMEGSAVFIGCTFNQAGKIAVAGGGTIFVGDSIFEGSDAGLVAQHSPGLAVVACHFNNIGIPVQAQGGARVVLDDNVGAVTPVRRPDTGGFQIDGGGQVVFAGNALSNFTQAVTLTGQLQSPALIKGNRLINPGGGLYLTASAGSGQPGARLTDNLIGNSTQFGVLVTKGATAELTHNVILVHSGPGLALQEGAGATLSRNDIFSPVEAVALRGDSAAKLTLQGDRIAGPITPGATGYAQDDASRRFSTAYNAPQAAAAFGSVAEAVNSAWLAAGNDDTPAVRTAYATFAGGLDTLASMGAAQASVTLHLVDALGQNIAQPFDVALDQDGKPGAKVAAGTTADPWAVVPAGVYWLVPAGAAEFAQRVTLASGQKLDVAAPAASAVALRFATDEKKPTETHLVVLKPEDRRRRALARLQYADRFPAALPAPRTTATPETVAAALAKARVDFPLYADPEAAKKAVAATPQGQPAPNFTAARLSAARILAIHGDEDDVALLERATTGLDAYSLIIRANEIGHAEARLGSLAHGRLAAWLHGADHTRAVPAAIVLRHFGYGVAEDLLVDYLEHPPASAPVADLAAFALFNASSDAVLNAMRHTLDRSVASGAFAKSIGNPYDGDAGFSAALYLLAYGNTDDLRRVAALTFGRRSARYLAYLVLDPAPLEDFLIASNSTYDLVLLSPALRDLPGKTEAFAVQLENRVLAHALAAYGPHPSTPDRYDAEAPWHTLRLDLTFWRPHLDAAQLLSSSANWLDEPSWTPWHVSWNDSYSMWLPWPISPKLDVDWYVGNGRQVELDSFPVADVIQRFKALPDARKIFAQDLFLQFYSVATRAFTSTYDSFHDGFERRPYLVRDSKKGAISGVLLAQPALAGRSLRLSLLLDQRVFYIKDNIYDSGDPATMDINRYAVDSGHALISAVRIWRGGKDFTVTESPAQKGIFTYTADVGQTDFSGLRAEVTFTFFGQTSRVVLDLFTSDAAAALRRANPGELAP